MYTSLGWNGSMVVRYRTGDIAQGLTWERCPYCKRTVPRLHYDVQRKSQYKEMRLTKLKGELVNLNAFYKIIHELKGIEEWQLEIKHRNDDPYDLDELHLRVSAKDGHNAETLVVDLHSIVKREIGVSPKITHHGTEELLGMLGMETELKESRIVDKRIKK